MQIQILNVTKETKPTAKSAYHVLDIAYKNLTYQGKVEGKKVMSFGATANTFNELANASSGDVYDIEVVKNEKGYNDWVSAKKSVGGSTNSSPTQASARSSSASPSPKSTYETPEERAKRQVYIVRQSSISSAIELLGTGAKSAPKVDDVIAVAKEFEAYVFGDEKAKVDQPLTFDDLENPDVL